MSYNASQINVHLTGDGPPAIMIHGNPATHTLWRPLVDRLGDARRIHAIDLPGFGGSPAPTDGGDYALDKLAATVLRYADLRGIESFDLIGHSFGGGVSLTLAAMAPERIRSLVAITPITDAVPPMARLLSLPMLETIAVAFWRAAPGGIRRLMVRNWTHISYGAGYSRARAEEVAREADRPDLVPAVCGLMRNLDYASYRGVIERIAARDRFPLLLIGAERDKVIPYRQFSSLAARAHATSMTVLPNCGHVPMWQYPDQLTAMVREFWRNSEV